MIVIENQNAKELYTYKRYNVKEVTTDILAELVLSVRADKRTQKDSRRNSVTRYLKSHRVGKGRYALSYYEIYCSFDIETYTKVTTDEDGHRDGSSYMYTWQFGLNNNVIIGHEWLEFVALLELLKSVIQPSVNQRVICWVHNLGYEFSFCREWLKIDNAELNFFKEQRKPVFFTHDGWLMFRDSMAMTNSSLERLAKDYTNTQKAKGDLDYTYPYVKTDILDNVAQGYCDNDVLILTEFSRYMFNTYIANGKLPLTISGVLRDIIKTECVKWCESKGMTLDYWLGAVQRQKPKDLDEYLTLVNWVYRGGYVHGNAIYTGDIFTAEDSIAGFDFTSSYPSVMFMGYYPNVWRWVACKSSSQLDEYCTSKCVIFKATFHGIQATTDHTIESSSKCVELVNAVLDNGRVYSADKLTVWLTELDYATYKDFYSWDDITIHCCEISERCWLADYIVKPMCEKYVAKYRLKLAHENYSLEKALVNTFYGVTVTRLPLESCAYANGEWTESAIDGAYEKDKAKNVLVPYVGVYVSAHARRNLLKTVKQIEDTGHSVLYCDTDSIKILGHDSETQAIIDAYNQNIASKLEESINHYGIEDTEPFSDLGMFDLEYGADANNVVMFKYLGAKRYLISYTDKKGLHNNQTIAGLPKNWVFTHRHSNKLIDVYRAFNDDMTVSSCKLTSKYVDEPSVTYVRGVRHYEKTSVALIPCDFTLSLNELWLDVLADYYGKRLGEKRITG